MTPSTPLPEQGGFDERLSEITHILYNQFEKPEWGIEQIRTLVLEEIIGEDKSPIHYYENDVGDGYKDQTSRIFAHINLTKAEQRKKLGGHS